MAKQKKISPITSYDSIFNRFQENTLLKSDYSFIASLFREFKDGIMYNILKARINSDIQTILRTPKQMSESPKDLGHLEGLDGCLRIIDQLAKCDENLQKEVEDQRKRH